MQPQKTHEELKAIIVDLAMQIRRLEAPTGLCVPAMYPISGFKGCEEYSDDCAVCRAKYFEAYKAKLEKQIESW